MDKKELYQKAEKALNFAFESAKHSVKIVSEKAGEAAHVTKLLIEKATLEHKVSKKFAELGGRVYEISVKEGRDVLNDEPEMRVLVEDAQKLDEQLAQIEAALEQERRNKETKK